MATIVLAPRSLRTGSGLTGAVAEAPPLRYLSRKCNLILVAKKRRGQLADFRQIAAHVRELAPDIRPLVIRDRYYNRLRMDLWFRPTLTIAVCELRQFRPVRGPICQNDFLSKNAEYHRLEAAGIPVPRWKLVTENHVPDVKDLGRYVVVKPDCGGRGAEVKIKRSGHVWKPPEINAHTRPASLV